MNTGSGGCYCVDCGGKGLCLHGKRKGRCVECGGKKQVYTKSQNGYFCEECDGKGLCLHGKQKGSYAFVT